MSKVHKTERIKPLLQNSKRAIMLSNYKTIAKGIQR